MLGIVSYGRTPNDIVVVKDFCDSLGRYYYYD